MGGVSTAERGRELVIGALRARGATVVPVRQGRRHVLALKATASAETIMVRTKTRTAGTWQGTTEDADPDARPTTPPWFWIFVDLSGHHPRFFIVPDDWMRRDIHEDYQRYLARHGGRRAVTEGCVHHAIEEERIRPWLDRWDLLGLPR